MNTASPCPTTSFNAMQASRKARIPILQSAVKVTSRVTSSYASTRGVAASLDHHSEEEGDHSFHQYHMNCLKYGSPKQEVAMPPHHVVSSSPAQKDCQVDPLWRTRRWLEECKEKFIEEELAWWPLICPLTDGINVATYCIVQRLLAVWQLRPSIPLLACTYGVKHRTIPWWGQWRLWMGSSALVGGLCLHPPASWGGCQGKVLDAQGEEFPPEGFTAGGGLPWRSSIDAVM